jgi:hypothetical protein
MYRIGSCSENTSMEGAQDSVDSEGHSQERDVVRVAVIGGSPIVGEVLSLLLRGADYEARFVPETELDDLDLSSDGFELLLLTPGFCRPYRRNVLAKVSSAPAAQVTVVELVTASEELQAAKQWPRILWPCPVERLERELAAILAARCPPKE